MRNNRGWLVALVVVTASMTLMAQRGGGGRGASRPITRTSYESAEYGFAFPVPAGMDLYTPDQPGAFRRVFTERRIVYLVNPMHEEESISIKYSDGATDADVRSYRTMLDGTPPQAKLPGFLKLGVADVPIGKDGAKSAVNFVYNMTTAKTDKAPGMDLTLRQLVFVHNGRGFTITCEAAQKRFEKVNKDTFDRFLSTIAFK